MPSEGVKSAFRVFKILEYFESVRRPLSVAEVAQYYGYPASSTSAIMRTMAELGYLLFNRSQRTYHPTPRLPLLVKWVRESLYDEDNVLHLMQDLSTATGETIILGTENGRKVRYIHVIEGTGSLRLHAVAGAARDYPTTAIGLMLMSQWDKRRAVGYLNRFNAESASSKSLDGWDVETIEVNSLLKRLKGIKREQYVKSIGGVTKAGGAIAMLLPRISGDQPMAIAIAGGTERVEENSKNWLALIRERILHYFSDDEV